MSRVRRVKVGDVVNVVGCHSRYAPTVRAIDGEHALVSSLIHWPAVRVHLSKLEPLGDRKAKRGRKRIR